MAMGVVLTCLTCPIPMWNPSYGSPHRLRQFWPGSAWDNHWSPEDHKVLFSCPKYSLNDVPGLQIPQIVELLIFMGDTKELSIKMAG